METKITKMFGVKYPIICGAMMWLCEPNLCAAVSNAGGLGDLTAANYETEESFRDAIKKVRELTDKPFMVSVTILPSVRITPGHHKMYLQVCAEERVAGVEISGSPIDKGCGPEYIDLLKKAGVKMFQKVGSVRHAIHAEQAGYDGIYAAGFEEGGHPLNDDVTTMVLTPRIVESVSIPVVTVGGISNGRTMAAAFMLGAEGVMMASRFMATQECVVHENIKKELVRRQEHETALICKSVHLQARAIKNKNTRDVLELESKGCSFEEILPHIVGQRIAEAWKTGDVELAPMMVGQSIGLINDVPSCRELMDRMMKEAAEQINHVKSRIQ